MTTYFGDIADWLVTTGVEYADLRSLTDQLVRRLRDEGFPLNRLNLGVLALHPEMAGYAVLWSEGMDEAAEFPIRREDTFKPTYLASPIRTLVESREPAHFDLEDPATGSEYPIVEEFRQEGYTHYLGFPILYGEDGTGVLTVCTKRPGGFNAEEVVGIERILPVLRLLISAIETRRLAKTVLRTYLGRNIGERVLAGEIVRGQGETIQAALWLSDLRGFTALTSELGAVAIIDVMNEYFDCMAEAVWAEGGEVLKFMGDAMLAVFRIDEGMSEQEAAQRATRAASDALKRLEVVSEKRIEEGFSALRAGIAVHLGTVVYGNIGASTRLDFTVIGEAVNLVARIQHLTAEIGAALLLSKEVAEHVFEQTECVGLYSFKGVKEPVEVFQLGSSKDTIG
jgi:adenylate cyclase